MVDHSYRDEAVLEENVKLRAQVKMLLKQIGTEGKCRGCQADIFWVVHKNGKNVPYTPEGLNHFADCPEAGKFRRK